MHRRVKRLEIVVGIIIVAWTIKSAFDLGWNLAINLLKPLGGF